MNKVINGCGGFETFQIGNRILEMEDQVRAWQARGETERLNIVVAVPGFDESMRWIYQADRALYEMQVRDAQVLVDYLDQNVVTQELHFITEADAASDLMDALKNPVDIIILLHEFTEVEEQYLIDELHENQLGMVNQTAEVIRIY